MPSPPEEHLETVTEFSRRTGLNRGQVKGAISQGHLKTLTVPATTNRAGFEFRIRPADAAAYLAYREQKGLDRRALPRGQSVKAKAKKKTLDTERCASCGTEKGNILCDMSSSTAAAGQEPQVYGYLCSRCYKLVHDLQNQVARTEQVLAYLKRTRNK